VVVRVPLFKPYVNERAIDSAAKVLRSGWIGEGPKVKEFERALVERFKFKYVKAVNSGTSAIRLALAMVGVGPGDEVISTAQTCSATNTAILEQFARPVFADVQYMTGNIDPADIERRVTDKTRAILCVHWAGYPCDMDELLAIGVRRSLPIIEDAAHALGATYHGKPIGTISPFTCFSLQAIKTLTTIDGGLLATLRPEDDEEALIRRWFGIHRDARRMRPDGYWFWNQTLPGFKYHMNDVSAAVGLGNLADVDMLLAQRKAQAEWYRGELAGVTGVTLFEQGPDRESAHWLFTLHVERRDEFCMTMRGRGVDASIVHIRNDVHDVFGGRRADLPTLDAYEKTHVSIPLGWWVSLEDAAYVCDCIKAGW